MKTYSRSVRGWSEDDKQNQSLNAAGPDHLVDKQPAYNSIIIMSGSAYNCPESTTPGSKTASPTLLVYGALSAHPYTLLEYNFMDFHHE